MKTKLLLSISFPLIITGCATNKIQGTWRHEDQKVIASFVFEPNNKCIFGFVPKGAPDGISPACTYKLENNIVTISFESKSKNDDTMLLKYNENEKTLSEIKTNEVFFDFKFKKYNGL